MTMETSEEIEIGDAVEVDVGFSDPVQVLVFFEWVTVGFPDLRGNLLAVGLKYCIQM